MQHTIDTYQFLFLKRMACVDTSLLLIHTCHFLKRSGQSESVFHFFIVSYWSDVQLSLVSNGEWCCSGVM
jgi:hypothetical protein